MLRDENINYQPYSIIANHEEACIDMTLVKEPFREIAENTDFHLPVIS